MKRTTQSERSHASKDHTVSRAQISDCQQLGQKEALKRKAPEGTFCGSKSILYLDYLRLSLHAYIAFGKPIEMYTLKWWILLHINYTSINKQKIHNLPQKRIRARLQHRGVNAIGKDLGGVRRWGIWRRHRPAGPEAENAGHLGEGGSHQEGWDREGTLGGQWKAEQRTHWLRPWGAGWRAGEDSHTKQISKMK